MVREHYFLSFIDYKIMEKFNLEEKVSIEYAGLRLDQVAASLRQNNPQGSAALINPPDPMPRARIGWSHRC